MTKGRVLGAAVAIMAAVFLVQVGAVSNVSAQYPPPNGNLVCTTDVAVSIDGMSYVSATLTDSAGTPVPGELITFEILSGPAGASLRDTAVITDGNGVATTKLLTAGATGNVSISATTDSAECRAVTEVKGTVFRPPSTGDGGLAGIESATSSSTYIWMAGQIIALAMLGAVAGFVWKRQAEEASQIA